MHISLRKKPAAPEPEPVEEAEQDVEEQELGEEQEDGKALSLPAALVHAVKAWFAWGTARLGATATYWGHVFAVWACAYYRGWVLIAVPLVLLTVVGLFVPRSAINQFAERVEERRGTAKRADAEAVEEPPIEPLLGLLQHLIGDARGVHLKTLLEHLEKGAAEAGQEPPSRADVEAKLAALRVPLRPSVRNAAGRVNRGVYRADLEAALAPSPDEATDPAPDV
ncbi:hypothetical protein ACIRJS_32970 [Streptomyces sp. NPDC102340]|uniref:hypothetical protein n=1 Tax=unclassified Streptomyces TaxID=2593676 RepID=UPI003826334B